MSPRSSLTAVRRPRNWSVASVSYFARVVERGLELLQREEPTCDTALGCVANTWHPDTLGSLGQAIDEKEKRATTMSKKARTEDVKPQDLIVTSDGRIISVTPRPRWRESETGTKQIFERGLSEQTSFLARQEVTSGKKGSVRPDLYGDARSVEVKNYLINSKARRDRLVRVIAKQALQRAAELPAGTRQLVRLDLSGQTGVIEHLPALAAAIEKRSGGIIRRTDVHWTVSLFPELRPQANRRDEVEPDQSSPH